MSRNEGISLSDTVDAVGQWDIPQDSMVFPIKTYENLHFTSGNQPLPPMFDAQ